MAMTIAQFRGWTRKRLGQDGCSTVSVELTDSQIDIAMDLAKEWWNAFQGLYREHQVQVVEGMTEMDVSNIVPKIDEIVKIWVIDNKHFMDYRGLYPGFLDVNGIPYDFSGGMSMESPLATITQTMQSISSSRRVLSADFDWEFIKDDSISPTVRKIRFMPAPFATGNAVIFYRIEPSEIKLEMYGSRDQYMIREWAFAECKYILGRIRGKYSGGLPSAGADRQMDGEALIQESIADKERLEQKILDYAGPVMPVIG